MVVVFFFTFLFSFFFLKNKHITHTHTNFESLKCEERRERGRGKGKETHDRRTFWELIRISWDSHIILYFYREWNGHILIYRRIEEWTKWKYVGEQRLPLRHRLKINNHFVCRFLLYFSVFLFSSRSVLFKILHFSSHQKLLKDIE